MAVKESVKEMAQEALKRNTKYFEEQHKKLLEDIQKLQDKLDDLLDADKRRVKAEKLQDKIVRKQEDLAVFEGMFEFTKTAKTKLEE